MIPLRSSLQTSSLLASLLLMAATALPAAPPQPVDTWKPTGFAFGYGQGVASASPADPDVVYLQPGHGFATELLLRSGDGGRNFLDRPNNGVYVGGKVLVDRLDANRLWKIGRGSSQLYPIYRSDDGGASWRQVASFDRPIKALAQSSSDADQLLVVTETAVWRSVDHGQTFQRQHDLPRSIYQTPLVESADAWLLAFASDCHPHGYGCLFEVSPSLDGGATWQAGFSIRAEEIDLAVHPAARSTVYALTNDGDVARSDDAGRTFAQVADLASPPFDGLYTTTEEIHGDPIVASRVWAIWASALWRSDDRGATWSEVAPASFRESGRKPSSVAFPGAGSTLVVPALTVTGSVVMRSEDGGASWQVAPALLAGGVDSVVATAAEGYFLAGASSGLYRSLDHGESWQILDASIAVNALAVDPVDASTFWVAGESPLGNHQLRRTMDGGATFTDVSPLPGERIQALAAVRHNGATALVAVAFSNDGELHHSADGGSSWQTVNVGVDRLGDLFSDGTNLYTQDGGGWAQTLYRSTDGGASFSVFTPVPPFRYFAAGGGKFAGVEVNGQLWIFTGHGTFIRKMPTGVSKIVLDRFGRIYLLGDDEHRGIFRSLDDGATWQSLETGLSGLAFDLVADPSEAGRLLAATESGPLAGHFGENMLSLGRGRFQVWARWRNSQGMGGVGVSKLLTTDSGAFSFFDAERTEVVVKLLDGRAVNGRFWFFVGSLTNVEFDLEVTDTVSGEKRTYTNPQGTFASFGDTEVFPMGASQPAQGVPGPNFYQGSFSEPPTRLQNRFELTVSWRVGGETGEGEGRVLSDDTAAFTYFSAENTELLVNVIDGRALNGKFWVFAGSLSNVEYTLTVRDLATGAVKTYENPAGTFASFGDTSAF